MRSHKYILRAFLNCSSRINIMHKRTRAERTEWGWGNSLRSAKLLRVLKNCFMKKNMLSIMFCAGVLGEIKTTQTFRSESLRSVGLNLFFGALSMTRKIRSCFCMLFRSSARADKRNLWTSNLSGVCCLMQKATIFSFVVKHINFALIVGWFKFMFESDESRIQFFLPKSVVLKHDSSKKYMVSLDKNSSRKTQEERSSDCFLSSVSFCPIFFWILLYLKPLCLKTAR